MENTSKYVGYAFLAISVIALTILVLTGNHISLIPIDQSLCPPEVGIAADGTCGIYEGKKVTTAFTLSAVAGVIGFISMAFSYYLSKK